MINLTQHKATLEQIKQGVIDLDLDIRKYVCELLTFEDISETSSESLTDRANKITEIANLDGVHDSALIGGALYFMPYLISALKQKGIKPFYSFTKRETLEEVLPDGSIKKICNQQYNHYIRHNISYASIKATCLNIFLMETIRKFLTLLKRINLYQRRKLMSSLKKFINMVYWDMLKKDNIKRLNKKIKRKNNNGKI